MIELNNHQIDLLYELCEIQLKWLNDYCTPSTFEEVLKLNHQKLYDILSAYDSVTNELIIEVLSSIKVNYQNL